MISIFFAAAAALSTPSVSTLPPGDSRGFGDWSVGCDNVLSCEAISLRPEYGEDSNDYAEASLTIRSGSDPRDPILVGIRDVGESYQGDTYVLVINGVPGPVAIRADGDDHFRFSGSMEDMIALVRDIAQADTLSLLDNDAHPMGRVSASGSAASMRYVDEAQLRANTDSAFVATGNQTFTGRMLQRPRIRNIVPEDGATADALSTAEAIAVADANECYRRDEDTIRRNAAHALGNGATLILLACGDGAYNFNDIAFVRRNGELEAARFDYTFSWGQETSPPMLVNTYWNDEQGILSTYAKGRGIGDCGTSESYAWDGTMFRMTERREMNGCRGSLYWIPVYRAIAEPVE